MQPLPQQNTNTHAGTTTCSLSPPLVSLLHIINVCSFLLTLCLDIPQVKVRPGQDVTLQCQGPRGVNITLLEWIRPELKPEGYVFFYRNRRPYEDYHHERFKGRVELTDPSVKHGDVSLILRNVSVGDTGTYKCRIITSNSSSGVRVQSEFKQSINLTVTDSGEFLELHFTYSSSHCGRARDICNSVWCFSWEGFSL
uniref:Ig-like domain-containing protein n=1 Tax=Amphilophus citrinellus TaxID=61819 RepID=A0A3Q0QVX0_AMPCI